MRLLLTSLQLPALGFLTPMGDKLWHEVTRAEWAQVAVIFATIFFEWLRMEIIDAREKEASRVELGL